MLDEMKQTHDENSIVHGDVNLRQVPTGSGFYTPDQHDVLSNLTDKCENVFHTLMMQQTGYFKH